MVRRMLRGGGVCEVVLEGSERRREGNRSHQENKQTNKQTNKEIQNRHTQHFLNKQEEQSCQQTTTGRHISDKIAKRRSSVVKPGFRNGSVWFLRDDVWCGGWWEEGRCQSARSWWREVEGGRRLTEATKKTNNQTKRYRTDRHNNSSTKRRLGAAKREGDRSQQKKIETKTRRAILPTDNNRKNSNNKQTISKMIFC